MGMPMNCQGNHAVVASVDLATELRPGTNLMMNCSVEHLQGMEVGNVI